MKLTIYYAIGNLEPDEGDYDMDRVSREYESNADALIKESLGEEIEISWVGENYKGGSGAKIDSDDDDFNADPYSAMHIRHLLEQAFERIDWAACEK